MTDALDVAGRRRLHRVLSWYTSGTGYNWCSINLLGSSLGCWWGSFLLLTTVSDRRFLFR
jgi:FtsH-binding integral membrane protein